MDVKTGIYVHGLNTAEPDWRERIWGIPPYILGRSSRAIQLLATQYSAAKRIVFGSGGSMQGDLKEAEYTLQQIVAHFEELRMFDAFARMPTDRFMHLRKRFINIARPETRSHNTRTEVQYALSRFNETGIRRIVLVSDYPHIIRCGAHMGEALEEAGLENKVEIVLEHSFCRHQSQNLASIRVFEPEINPDGGIQLGDLAAQILKVQRGKRSAFAAELEALVAKYSTE